jgi:hypothetical protein
MSRAELERKYFEEAMARLNAVKEGFDEMLTANKPLLASLEKERTRFISE